MRLRGVIAAMPNLLAAIAVVLVVASPGSSAAAAAGEAADEVTSQQVSMVVEAGLAGYVDATAPVQVSVELTAVTLTVGQLELDFGGRTSTAVEVPAGGVKRYDLVGPGAGNRRQLEVSLLDAEGEEILSQTIRVQVTTDKVLVGTLDIEGVDTALRSAVSTPLEREVTVLPVELSDIGPRLAPLDYLIVGPGALAGIEPDVTSALSAWVDDGGRLYGPAAEIAVIAAPGGGTPLTGTEIVVTRIGSGEIGATEAPMAILPETWSRVLRDRPDSAGIVDQARPDASLALVSAASAGQDASVPALPWLLAGIVVFVLLVGPVNFLVLRSLGRPEWAWLTVPALSLVFLGLFWGVGRSQLADFSASHGAVVIDTGSGASAQAGFLLQVATAGEHVLALPEGWEPVPPAGNLGGGSARGVVTDTGVTFELADLGLGATEVRWSEDSVALPAEVTAGSEGLRVVVTNDTPWTMWGWGVVVNGVGFNGREPLEPGAQGEVEIPSGLGRIPADPVIAETVGRRPFDPDRSSSSYDVVYPLASYLEQRLPQMRQRGVYVFGVTADRTFPLSLDGRSAESAGTALLVRRVDVVDADLAALGAVRPEVLSVQGASSIERYGDEVYAYGAEAVYLQYAVPAGAPERGMVGAAFTGFDRVEIFDWDTATFQPFTWGAEFDVAAATSGSGEIVIRASVTDDTSFFDQSISLQRYALKWVDA